MPNVDACEAAVIRALEKAGWTLFRRPHHLSLDTIDLYIDLMFRNRQRPDHFAAVEVKCFLELELNSLYRALGQYVVYRAALQYLKFAYPVYLAIPSDAWNDFQNDPMLLSIFHDNGIRLIVIDLKAEEVVKWINS